jgi:hypothetical protein
VARGVAKDRAIVTPKRAGTIHLLQRLAPGLVEKATARSVAKELAHRSA